MAEQGAHVSQAPLLPPLEIDHEDFGDVIPLMGLSRHSTADFLKSSSSIDHETVPPSTLQDEHWTGNMDRPSSIHRRSSTTISDTSSAWEHRLPSAFSRPLKILNNALQPISARITLAVRNSRFHGWRMGVLLGCCMSFLVLCCNIALIVIGATSASGYDAFGISKIIEGDEALITRWNTVLHIFINALSTVLLSASNYTMQVLSSPTRKDIDAAHAKGKWLDIGLLSPRNLLSIPRRRATLWLILATSSIPLHLFYNASIFRVSVARYSYQIVTIDIASQEWQRLNETTDKHNWTAGVNWNLTNRWRDIYDKPLLFGHGDLYLGIDRIATDTAMTPWNLNTSLSASELVRTNVSGSQLTLQSLIMSGTTDWISLSYHDGTYPHGASLHVKEAASKKETSHSTVQVSLYFLIVVASFNAVKFVVLLFVLLTDRSAYLVTLGDAASSFMERQDPHTVGKCLLGREELLTSIGRVPHSLDYSEKQTQELYRRMKGVWLPRPRSLFPIKMSKFLFLFLSTFVIIPLFTIPTWGSGADWGWATASNAAIYSSNTGSSVATLWSAWLSNVPQLLLSICYFTINRICTSIAGADEWNRLATGRKSLRVTQPYGRQRSTYFLQLPYKWSIPLTVISGTLHWLVSQTFFLVRLDPINDDHGPSEVSACGFSLLSFTVLFSFLAVLQCAIGIVGLRKMPMNAPTAASCSLAISAACHPPPGDANAHLAKVQWGVTENEVVTGFRHCSLSSKPVSTPEEGETYY